MPEIIYRSAVRGWDDDSDEKPTTLYFGIVQRLRRTDLDKDTEHIVTVSAAEARRQLGPRRLSDGSVVEPDPHLPVERLEVFALDEDDEDIIVMWRIPMRPVR
jgi:hypothetical protein